MTVRSIVLLIVLFLFSASFAQMDSTHHENNSLHINYLKGNKTKMIVLCQGQRLKVDLNNGDRKKGVIEEVLENCVVLDGDSVYYSDIKAIKNRGYSKSVGKATMMVGANGILAGAALAGMGALILDTNDDNFFGILFGFAALAGGIIIASYAGVVVLAGLIIDLATKKLVVDRDKVTFEAIPDKGLTQSPFTPSR